MDFSDQAVTPIAITPNPRARAAICFLNSLAVVTWHLKRDIIENPTYNRRRFRRDVGEHIRRMMLHVRYERL